MKGAFDNLLFYSGLFRGWSYLYTVIFGWSKFAYPVVPRWSIPNQASYQLLYPFAYSVVLWWSIPNFSMYRLIGPVCIPCCFKVVYIRALSCERPPAGSVRQGVRIIKSLLVLAPFAQCIDFQPCPDARRSQVSFGWTNDRWTC